MFHVDERNTESSVKCELRGYYKNRAAFKTLTEVHDIIRIFLSLPFMFSQENE